MNASELSARINTIAENLAARIDAAGDSEAVTRYLKFAASFYQYSMGNQMLIAWQAPHATMVKGFHDWLKMGRHVKKGEKGIAILAPCIIPANEETGDRAIMRFKTVYVFDATQTEGEPLPQPTNWKSLEQRADLAAMLAEYAAAEGIVITIAEQKGETQGRALYGGHAISLAPTAGTKTLIHEIAHALMHMRPDSPDMPRATMELEAESVAYIVGQHFDLDASGAPNYIALHGMNADDLRAHLTRITATAKKIISDIDPNAKRSQIESPRRADARHKREQWHAPDIDQLAGY